MPTRVPDQHGHHCGLTTEIPREQAGPYLSVRTLAWLARHPLALMVVESVWGTLDELAAAGAPAPLIAALRFVLVHHEPSWAGRCRACRRGGWRSVWRRRRFPCVVWRQIRGELLGHLHLSGAHHLRPDFRLSRHGVKERDGA